MKSTVTILIVLQVHWDIFDNTVTQRSDCETLLYKYCCYLLTAIVTTTTTARTSGMQYMICPMQRPPKII